MLINVNFSNNIVLFHFASDKRCPSCRKETNRRNILKLFFGHEHDASNTPYNLTKTFSQSTSNIPTCSLHFSSVTSLECSHVAAPISTRRSTICGLKSTSTMHHVEPKFGQRAILGPAQSNLSAQSNVRAQRVPRPIERTVFRKKLCLICNKKFTTINNNDLCDSCMRKYI